MSNAPGTRPRLLARILDRGDRLGWSQFAEIYAPLSYGFARRSGLQDADVTDLTLGVLRVVARSIGRTVCPARGQAEVGYSRSSGTNSRVSRYPRFAERLEHRILTTARMPLDRRALVLCGRRTTVGRSAAERRSRRDGNPDAPRLPCSHPVAPSVQPVLD